MCHQLLPAMQNNDLQSNIKWAEVTERHMKDENNKDRDDWHCIKKCKSIYGSYIEVPLLLLQDSSAAVQDEESCVHRALMKYLDAWSLSPDSWEYNLHVGRLLLLQGRSREALQHLQNGLAMQPLHPALRSGHRWTVGSRSRKSAAVIIIAIIMVDEKLFTEEFFTHRSHSVPWLTEKKLKYYLKTTAQLGTKPQCAWQAINLNIDSHRQPIK